MSAEADDLRALLVDDIEAATAATIAPGPFAPSTTPYAALQGVAQALVDWRLGNGNSWKRCARVATNDVLPPCTYLSGALLGSGALPAIDGVTLALNDRVLVWLQVDPAQNGIYSVASLSPWVLQRTDDADVGDKLHGAIIEILEGDSATLAYLCPVTGTVTLGTTALAWQQWPAPYVPPPAAVVPWDVAQNDTTSTGNATPTVIQSWTPPAGVQCAVLMESTVVAYQGSGVLAGAWMGMKALFRVDFGAVTLVGNAPEDDLTEFAGAVALGTNGSALRATVTGLAATSIDWNIYTTFRVVS